MVSPDAYSEITWASSPSRRRVPCGTSLGSKVPLRSLGTEIGTAPISVVTVLAKLPLRELPEPRPSRAWGS